MDTPKIIRLTSVDLSYLRIKRKNQTFCFLCDADQTVKQLKEKVSAALDQHGGSKETIRLLLAEGGAFVDDETRCTGFKDDTVLRMVFQISEDEYEEVDVESSAT